MNTVTTTTQPNPGRKPADVLLPQCEITDAAVGKTPRRVLVVDDEALLRWSIAEMLAGLDLEVVQAWDAASALRAITKDAAAFDVIILDLRLPDMCDLSLLATIRQVSPATAVVLMTAFGTDEVIERAIALGARSVLHKPFELDSLVDAVYGVAN